MGIFKKYGGAGSRHGGAGRITLSTDPRLTRLLLLLHLFQNIKKYLFRLYYLKYKYILD